MLLAIVTLGGFAFLSPSASALQGGGQIQVPTTKNDFFLFGTQPNTDPNAFVPIYSSSSCSGCHGGYSDDVAPFDTWVVSMMAQAARDPVWSAARGVATQDANAGGSFCVRCHAPGAWLSERGHDTSANGVLTASDMEGINCHFCHRVVNPTEGALSAVGYPATNNPTPDPAVLDPLSQVGILPAANQGNATYVVDPQDARRGPFSDVPIVGVPLPGGGTTVTRSLLPSPMGILHSTR